ncbi:MAG: hypothetical protein IIA14_13385 [SAR324 cluster bacterium]|nr:hypothetical protein [SAR324 cluster bacterium]
MLTGHKVHGFLFVENQDAKRKRNSQWGSFQFSPESENLSRAQKWTGREKGKLQKLLSGLPNGVGVRKPAEPNGAHVKAEGKMMNLLTEIHDKAMDLEYIFGGLEATVTPDDMNGDCLEAKRASGNYSFFRLLQTEVSNNLDCRDAVEEGRVEILHAVN